MRQTTIQANVAAIQKTASSTSVGVILTANPSRLGATILNASEAALTLKMGTGAADTDKSVVLAANGYYEVPFGYTGVITGLWASANGYAYATEFT